MGRDVDIFDKHPVEQDKILKFGEIGEAIASFTPKLESLAVLIFEWIHRTSLQEYPYAIGRALQPLANLKTLKLSFGVLYSDRNGAVSRAALKDAVPKSVVKLRLCEDLLDDELSDMPEDESLQAWKSDDLNELFQDDSFESLRLIQIEAIPASNRKLVDQEKASRHGWRVISDSVWDQEFENTRRPGSRKQ